MKISEEREEIEKLIGSLTDISSNNALNNPPNMSEIGSEPAFELDYSVLLTECDKKAKKLVQNATGLILSDEIVKNNPYLKNKMSVDIRSLSGMLYQLSVNETMQKALIEEVRQGAMHPRMFEVFGQLSKMIADLHKQLLQTVEVIKSTYKDLKTDLYEKNQEMQALTESGVTKNAKGMLIMGTKDLIKETKKLKIQNKETKDAEIINDVDGSYEIK